ncbi:MAG: hypothetical protein AAGG65_12000 [Pseudomonadota bacterium]
MTTLGIKVLMATLAGVLVGGAALAAQSSEAMTTDPMAMNDTFDLQAQIADDPDVVLPFDLNHQANLVVHCNIDGTEHAVASFEVCDAVGGSPVSAEI